MHALCILHSVYGVWRLVRDKHLQCFDIYPLEWNEEQRKKRERIKKKSVLYNKSPYRFSPPSLYSCRVHARIISVGCTDAIAIHYRSTISRRSLRWSSDEGKTYMGVCTSAIEKKKQTHTLSSCQFQSWTRVVECYTRQVQSKLKNKMQRYFIPNKFLINRGIFIITSRLEIFHWKSGIISKSIRLPIILEILKRKNA